MKTELEILEALIDALIESEPIMGDSIRELLRKANAERNGRLAEVNT